MLLVEFMFVQYISISNLFFLMPGFERTKNALIMEQEMTRGDVLRVVSELEELESEIQKHVARNTGCLDGPVLSKRKRRKRSPKRSRKLH